MGLKLTIQSLSQVAWPGTSGRDKADPESAQGRRRASNPAGAKTPEEAQAYIERLYKTGRTDELVALLRRSSVFRVAWQCLQQSSSRSPEEFGEFASAAPAGAATPDQSGLPAPLAAPGPGGRPSSPGRDLAAQVTAAPRFSQEIPKVQNYPVPVPKPNRALAAARRVYETQARYFTREQADLPRFSLRV